MNRKGFRRSYQEAVNVMSDSLGRRSDLRGRKERKGLEREGGDKEIGGRRNK